MGGASREEPVPGGERGRGRGVGALWRWCAAGRGVCLEPWSGLQSCHPLHQCHPGAALLVGMERQTGPPPTLQGATAFLGQKAVGCGVMWSQCCARPFVGNRRAKGCPALHPACALAPPPLDPPPLFLGVLLLPQSSPPCWSPWQHRRARVRRLVPGPQATSAWEGPGDWLQDGPLRIPRPPAAKLSDSGWGRPCLMAPHCPQRRARPSPDWKMRLTSWPRS